MHYFINLIKNKKIIFKKIKPYKILFLDNGYLRLNKKLKNSFTLDNSHIFIFPLLSALYEKIFVKSKKRVGVLYFKNLIKNFNPNIIISNELDKRISEIKFINKEIKTLIYQHNSLFINNTKKNLKKNSSNKSFDYFFVYDEYSKKIFSKYIKANYIISGSLNYNEYKSNYEPYKYDILFISEYRSKKRKIPTFCQKKILQFLNEYKNKRNIKICVALNSIRKEKKISFEEEQNFIKKYAPNIDISNHNSGYHLAANSKLTVFISSNLGAEILSSKKKVLGLFMKGNFRKKWKSDYISKKTNQFLSYTMNKEDIFKKIDFLLKIDKKKWLKILKSSKINLKYDYKNKIFLQTIKKLDYKI